MVRCSTCGAVHPAGFTFCLSCGRRIQGSRFWPRSPEPLRLAELGRGCPACEAPLADAIVLLVGENAGADPAPAHDLVIRGSEPGSLDPAPTHECRRCGRQFWVVRSGWEGWRLRLIWRVDRLWQGLVARTKGGVSC